MIGTFGRERMAVSADHRRELARHPHRLEVVPAPRIRSRTPQTLSPMPEGLLVTLSQEEILDLLAYLKSDG